MLKTVYIDVDLWLDKSKDIKIIQISDLHLTKKTPIKFLQNIIDIINAQKPDIVAITGDLCDDKLTNIAHLLKLLSQIQAPSYFVSGNHDMLHGLEPLTLVLESMGIRRLDNEKITLNINERALQLVGIADRMANFFRFKRDKSIILTLDQTQASVVLAHQPKDFKWISSHAVTLQLSGHTHGGQIFPFHYLVKLQQGYLSGLYKTNKSTLYVNSGLGTWGIHRRFLSKAEIALIIIMR